MKKKKMTRVIKVFVPVFLLNFILFGSSCVKTQTKIIEERDPIVKKIEEKDSMRIIKNTTKKINKEKSQK